MRPTLCLEPASPLYDERHQIDRTTLFDQNLLAGWAVMLAGELCPAATVKVAGVLNDTALSGRLFA